MIGTVAVLLLALFAAILLLPFKAAVLVGFFGIAMVFLLLAGHAIRKRVHRK